MNVIHFEDGRCKRIRSYLDSYLSNELLVETTQEVVTHLETCQTCSRCLEDRLRLKTHLKRAVMQEYAPPALRERIRSDLRRGRGFSFRTFSLAVAAVAVVAFFTFSTFFTGSPSKKPLSLHAEVAPGDVDGKVLKIGFDDHVFCTIDHKLANKQFTAEQMSEKLGPEYAGLIALVQENTPKAHIVTVGHRCHYQGREFIHLIIRNQDDVVSLVITRKNGETFPVGGGSAALEASGMGIHEASWSEIQVAGFETRDYVAFVVSNKTRDDNEQLAISLGPAISGFLRKLET
jgi:hypothetical protein